MPLDDRISQLSEAIIHEVRSPIEAALHRLLDDVMKLAGEDRDQAVQAAVAAAAVEHQSAFASAASEHEAAAAALREQLEQARDAAVASAREQLVQEHETELASVREDLVHEHETVLAGVHEDFARQREAALARLREELTLEHEAALQAAAEESARAHRVQLDERDAYAALERDRAVAEARDEMARNHESALVSARTAAEAVGAAALTAALSCAEQEKADAQATAADLARELEQARAEAVQAEQARLAAAQAAEDAEQLRLTTEQELELTHAADRQEGLACSDRMLAAVRRLDEARSLTGVFTALADQAASEIGRAVLLLVNGPRLRGLEVRGLPGVDPASIDAPVEPASVFGLAVSTGLPASTSDAPVGPEDDPLAALLAAPPDRAGMAVPISVGGRVVAVLYGDDAATPVPTVPSNWPEVAEILARHAGRCLELLTVSHAATLAGRVQQEPMATENRQPDTSPFADERREEDSARRYARLLISEIKLYNEPAVEQGRQDGNLAARLGPEIERARRLYEEKIPAAVRQRVDCFDQEVVRTLAGGDPGLLGQT